MPHPILHVIPEDPEKQHVSRQMQRAPMQEHRGQQPAEIPQLRHLGGDHGPIVEKEIERPLIREKRPVGYENHDIERDQPVGDIGCAPRRVMIADREHGRKLARITGDGKPVIAPAATICARTGSPNIANGAQSFPIHRR